MGEYELILYGKFLIYMLFYVFQWFFFLFGLLFPMMSYNTTMVSLFFYVHRSNCYIVFFNHVKYDPIIFIIIFSVSTYN